jgi:hypothetical protein
MSAAVKGSGAGDQSTGGIEKQTSAGLGIRREEQKTAPAAFIPFRCEILVSIATAHGLG